MRLTKDNYVEEADRVMKELLSIKNKKGDPVLLTTSKIRNLLAMTSSIYNDALNLPGDKLSDELVSRIQYLRVRTIYEAGRDTEREKPVKSFVEKSGILGYMEEIKDSKERFILFSRYMEALVAYRKYYGSLYGLKDE